MPGVTSAPSPTSKSAHIPPSVQFHEDWSGELPAGSHETFLVDGFVYHRPCSGGAVADSLSNRTYCANCGRLR